MLLKATFKVCTAVHPDYYTPKLVSTKHPPPPVLYTINNACCEVNILLNLT
jgi:hypothetical protein